LARLAAGLSFCSGVPKAIVQRSARPAWQRPKRAHYGHSGRTLFPKAGAIQKNLPEIRMCDSITPGAARRPKFQAPVFQGGFDDELEA
jgi:hypothetical protein